MGVPPMYFEKAWPRRPCYGKDVKDPRFAKFVLLINGLVPLAILCTDIATNNAGTNVRDYAIHTTGVLALLFLLLSLAVTPLRKIFNYNYLSNFRRSLGLFAFFYGCLHFLSYQGYDRGWSLTGTIQDVQTKRFILLGMGALLLMVPLAITSTNGMIKRLGAARWKQLHWLVYPAAVMAAIHFWMSTKIVSATAEVFAVVLAMLLGYRLTAALRKRTVVRAPSATPIPAARR